MEHPRIALLRNRVRNLPLDRHTRAVLLQSIEYFGDRIVARSRGPRHQHRDDLQSLPQAALGGMMERALQEKYSA